MRYFKGSLLSGLMIPAFSTLLVASCTSAGPSAAGGDDRDEAVGEAADRITPEQCNYFDVNGKVQICHHTSSATKPYTIIRVSEQACIDAHSAHAEDYVTSTNPLSPLYDPTCSGQGCLPLNAPCDPLVPCCGNGVCTNGVCTDLCAGVTCAASDSCHEAGTCDPQTGSCSNPVKTDGAQCTDGNSCTQSDVCTGGVCGGTPLSCPSPGAPDDCHVGVCSGGGTCSLANAPDGASCCGILPADRCGGPFHGTCEAGACTNINACGDGLVELALGESCDDGNTVDGDGCDAHCHVEPFQTTGPVKISGDLFCTTSVANAARKIAVDGSGTIFAVMRCSDVFGVTANVAVSTDRGQTFSAPLDLSTGLGTLPLGVAQVAVATGPSGVGYVAIMLTTGEVFLRTTQDKGATWSAGVSLGIAASTTAGLSLVAFNDDLYVGFRSLTGIAVARNHQRGAGAFAITNVGMTVSFFDLLFDVRLGTLAVTADTPAFHIRTSSDAGVTFAPEVNPPGSEFFSDWAIGNGTIFVSGTALVPPNNSTQLFLIPSSAPTTSTTVAGLPSVSAAQTRSVAADDAGNAFVASQLNGGGVQLDRLAAGATAFDAPRLIDPAGGSPIPGPLPGGSGAAVVYTVGSSVWVTIQAY
jgi:cysteine-rich repeat protein